MFRFAAFCLPAALLLALSGCGPSYSPDTYNSNAVQQANKVDQGVIVGVRQVGVSAAGTTGALTGGAAGGIVGSQLPGSSFTSAVGTLGGTLIGGIVGTTAEHTVDDTTAYEYIVRKTAGGDLLSVAQRDVTPMAIGQHVLVISGNQARVVPDYTVGVEPPKPPPTPLPAALPDLSPAPAPDGVPPVAVRSETPPAAAPAPTADAAPAPPAVTQSSLPPPGAPTPLTVPKPPTP